MNDIACVPCKSKHIQEDKFKLGNSFFLMLVPSLELEVHWDEATWEATISAVFWPDWKYSTLILYWVIVIEVCVLCREICTLALKALFTRRHFKSVNSVVEIYLTQYVLMQYLNLIEFDGWTFWLILLGGKLVTFSIIFFLLFCCHSPNPYHK